MPCAHKTELRVESPSGEVVFGFVVVGITESQFLELKAKFPDEGFKKQNPKLREAIKQNITQEEREQIIEHLRLRSDANPKFECETIVRYLDEAKEQPRFASYCPKNDDQSDQSPWELAQTFSRNGGLPLIRAIEAEWGPWNGSIR
jgi:hypothetical protein